MSNTSLSDKWSAAKARYDVAAKSNAKDRAAIQKQLDKLMAEGEKERKKIKTKEKLSSFIADAVLTQMQAPQLKAVITKIKAKKKELDAVALVQARPSVGCTPAFKDVDKVLEVGMRLRAGGVEDADKWRNWHKAAISSLKKCAAAEKKFKKWMGQPDRDNEAVMTFQREFAGIISKMQERGTPIMHHAGRIVQGT